MGGQFTQLYPFVMMLAVGAGFALSRHYKSALPIDRFGKIWIGMAAFTRAYGERVQIVGDDYLVTNACLVALAA